LIVLSSYDETKDVKYVAFTEDGRLVLLQDVLLVVVFVFGPVNASLFVVHHVLLFRQGKVESFDDGGRVDLFVFRIS